jgi:hypothetical protein
MSTEIAGVFRDRRLMGLSPVRRFRSAHSSRYATRAAHPQATLKYREQPHFRQRRERCSTNLATHSLVPFWERVGPKSLAVGRSGSPA